MNLSLFQGGMPQTLSSASMFTPCGFSPHLHSAKEDDQGGLIFQDGNLASASLDALIQHLIPTTDYYPEKAYIFTFLLSSRLFIEPHELLSRVCHKCVEQQRLDDPVLDKARIRKFGPKLLQLLTEWTETFPYDFQEERMIGHLKDMIDRIAPCDEAYWKRMNQLLQALNQKLATLSHGQEGIVKINAAVSDKLVAFKSKPPSIQREILTVCSDPYTLAQQLTHVELERLSHIGPEEFVQAFVHKDSLDSTKSCFNEQKKTSNLEAYVKWFNRLCYLVATEICMPAKKKQRAQVIEFFIDVARECFNIGNFNSLMAIISGMNMSPVSRLKKTWSKVKTAKFFILEHQMDPTGNFYNYRTALRGAAHRSLTAHSNREKMRHSKRSHCSEWDDRKSWDQGKHSAPHKRKKRSHSSVQESKPYKSHHLEVSDRSINERDHHDRRYVEEYRNDFCEVYDHRHYHRDDEKSHHHHYSKSSGRSRKSSHKRKHKRHHCSSHHSHSMKLLPH
uniref:RasGEF domain family member 1C n=2 Tax=Emydidae TaxID=8476 RepID=A0A8C3HA78_CHRPI